MSRRPDATNWRSELAGFVDGTDSNLRSLRKDNPTATLTSLPLGVRAPARQPEAVANARAELSTLLAAVQGSLADLRVEVAAAKRLSTNASAVVAGDMSPLGRGPANRASSAQPRARATTETTPPMQLRVPTPAPQYDLGQPFGPLFSTPQGSEALGASPHAYAPPIVTTPASVTSSAAPQTEELVKAIDLRLLELGHKIERSLERSMEEQSLRSQLQQAVQAAALQQQQQHLMMRNSAPPQVFNSIGGFSTATMPPAPNLVDTALVPSLTAPPIGAGSANSTLAGATAGSSSASGPSPLVLLAMNKADASEKQCGEIRSELQMLQKHVAKDGEEAEKRLSGLQDISRQHWEKMCHVSSQVDSLLAQRSGYSELQAEVARVAAKLVQLETSQDRTTASLDEQQRLIRQLTTGLQKLAQESDSEQAISNSRHGELVAKLEAAAARTGELEARVLRAGDVEARMSRVADIEHKLARVGELEGRVARVADLEARVTRLPDLELKMARMGDVDAKLARLGDVEVRLGRLGDMEGRIARLGDLDLKLARLADVETRLARLGDVETKLARMGEMEAKLARMGEIEAKLARMGEMEAKLARMGEMEARLARLAEVEARLMQMGDLEARVASLQASVAATAARSPSVALASPKPTPADTSAPEVLVRVSALESQVARLAAADQPSQVQERGRRRGHPGTGYMPADGTRSPDEVRASLAGVFADSLGSPSGPRRSSENSSTPYPRRPEIQASQDRPVPKVEERIKLLEDAMTGNSFGGSASQGRSLQTLAARVERLEQVVRMESSIEAMAQEARLAVAEEFVLELRRDFNDVVGPTLEKLAAHVSGLGQGVHDTKQLASTLNSRVDSLYTQLAMARSGAPPSGSPSTIAERLTVLEAQVRALNHAVEDNSTIFSRLQRHQTQLEKLQQEVEALRSSVGAQVLELQSLTTSASHDVEEVREAQRHAQDQLAALAVMDEQLSSMAATVKALERQQRGQQAETEAALERLAGRLGGQEAAAGTEVNSLAERLGEQEVKVEELQEKQKLVASAQSVTEEAVQHLKQRLGGQEAKVGKLEEQHTAVQATVLGVKERLSGQERQIAALKEQQEAAVRNLTDRLRVHENKVEELEEHQKAAEAASVAAAGLAATAAGAAQAAGAGAVAVSRSLGAGALQPEPKESSPVPVDAVDKAPFDELAQELKAKLADLRGCIGDVRKELGSKVQVLEAQTRELLAFREEILSSYVELQDGMERAAGVADHALRKFDEHDVKLQALAQQVDQVQAATATMVATEAKTRHAEAAFQEMRDRVVELQGRVSANASEQQERLEALDAKVHALSELLTAASHDSQVASEARTRAEELAYELSQVQEALESLAMDSGRLAEQLATVASTSDKSAEQLGRVLTDVQDHNAIIEKLQSGLSRLEGRLSAIPPKPPMPAASRSLLPTSEAEGEYSETPSLASTSGMSAVATERLAVTLPTSRSVVAGSQAILNPLYSSSSEDVVFAGIAAPASPYMPASQQGNPSAASQPLSPAPAITPLRPPVPRLRALDTLPPLPPEDSSVRDKALFYEQLASKKTEVPAAPVTRRGPAAPTDNASEPLSQESSGASSSHAQGAASISTSETSESAVSSSAAAATAAGAVGLAGLRQAVQAVGANRPSPPAPSAQEGTASDPVAAAGPLAAVRAARSGLGLSGELSAAAPEAKDGAEASPMLAASPSVFGREQTFRRGMADEEVSVSSADEEEQSQGVEMEGGPGKRVLTREQTYRGGAADEELSVSSDTDEADKAAGLANDPYPQQQTSAVEPSGFDDDDEFELSGLAPPGLDSSKAAAEPAAPVQAPVADGDKQGRSSSRKSDSGDIDEEIELEPGINPSGFDYDDEDDMVWAGSSSVAPSTSASHPLPGKDTTPADAGKVPPVSSETAPSGAPPGAAAAAAQDLLASTSGSFISGSIPQLAPLHLSGAAAAMFSISGESLSRRKLPPLGALGPLTGSTCGVAAALGSTSALSTSRGFDTVPPLLRPALGSLQSSGQLSGELQTLQVPIGELSTSRALAPLSPLRAVSFTPVGNPLGSPLSSRAVSPVTSDTDAAAPASAAPAPSPFEGAKASASAAAGASVPSTLPHKKSPLGPLAPLAPLTGLRGHLPPVEGVPTALPVAVPVSPLRSLLLAQPAAQPHPAASEDFDVDSPVPAVPGPATESSSSVPFVDAAGDLSALMEEPFGTLQEPATVPQPTAGSASVPPLHAQTVSGRVLASLLDSDSDSFHAASNAASREPSGMLPSVPEPPEYDAFARSSSMLSQRTAPGMDSAFGNSHSASPIGELSSHAPEQPSSVSAGAAVKPTSKSVMTPEDSRVTAAAASVVDEDIGYADDFEAGDIEIDRANSPAPVVAARPSAPSDRAATATGSDNGGSELELAGMGPAAGNDAFALGSTSGSLGSFDAPPQLPDDSEPAPAGSSARPSSLPPLPPGLRRNAADGQAAPSPPPPAASISRASLLTSEDSLALIAPPEGAAGGLLEDGSEDEDIFASSAGVKAAAESTGAGPMGPPPLPPNAPRTQVSRTSSIGSIGRNRQLPEQASGLSFEHSGSMDGELFAEAERVAAMLTAHPSNSSMLSAGPSGPAPATVPNTATEASRAADEDSRGTSTAMDSPLAETVPTLGPGPTVPDASIGSAPLVHGSLEFYEDASTSSSSSAASRAWAGAAASVGPTAAAPSAGAGVSGLSGAYSDSSMELEHFRPPPPAAAAAAGQQGSLRSSSSGENDVSTSGARHEQEERQAVPARPFGSSTGDSSTSIGAYRLQVVTGRRPGATCSKGAVRLSLYGSQSTHVAQLRPLAGASLQDQPADDAHFTAGATDEFLLDTAADLGDLSAIYIWHEGEGFTSSWYVESVTVEQLMTGLDWTFEVNDWVRGGHRGGRVVRLPGVNLSASREGSLARLASAAATSSGGPSPQAATKDSRPAQPVAPAGGMMPPRGFSALGDYSLDVSSDVPSPVERRDSDGLPLGMLGRYNPAFQAAYGPGTRLGAERSARTDTQSGSVNFSEADDDEDLVPGMGGSRGQSASGLQLSQSAFAGAKAAAAAAVGERPRVAANVPAGLGLVLEEDLEEMDGMLSSSAAFSLGPVSSRSGAGQFNPALVSPRPPLPPGAPRRRDLSDELDEASSDPRRQPQPPTPPANRKHGRRLSTSALEMESSHDSFGVGGGYGARRRVRISGAGEDDLTSELSVEGSELSIASVASLVLYAPGGVRPPPLGGAINMDYLGTSRKRVSWAEYAEEFEFLEIGGGSLTSSDDELLERQGKTTRPDASQVGYDALIRGSREAADASTSAAGPGDEVSNEGQPINSGADAAAFTEVPLKQRRGQHANSYCYKIKMFTADKLNAGLGNTTVHLELLGREATVTQTLPKERGTFQRGCVDRFTLYSTSGDMGQLLALKIWHDGKTLGPGNWGFEQMVIDDRLKGSRYVFRNPDPDCVLRKGRRHCLVLKPTVSRIDEAEDLAEVAREYETQLSANRDLSEMERAGLRGKLEKINQRLSKLGARLARSMSDSLGFK